MAHNSIDQDSNTLFWLDGGGEMGALIRSHDWSTSKVGPSSEWPQSLKTALSICVGTKFPMFVWWGKDLVVFYNDAYIPLAGPLKHPHYLGRTAREQWAEVWDLLQPLTEQVFKTGQATWSEDLGLFVFRKGFLEEAYFTFSYSPIRDETGNVGGIINPCQETTGRILSERRLKTLQDLGSSEPKRISDIGSCATRASRENARDIPFIALYLTETDQKSYHLVNSHGIEQTDLLRAEAWPLERMADSRRTEKIDGLRARFPDALPKFPYEEMPDSAVVVPLEQIGRERPIGFLILGVSSRLEFDETYQGFFTLLAKQITTHLSNVRTLTEERKRTEALAEIDRTKTQFFSNVSHEFRTPLTLLLGPIEDILQEAGLSERTLERANLIYRNTLRLQKLVNALLDFSRVEAGRMQATFRPVDLAHLTREVASSFESAMAKAGLEFDIHCETLPSKTFVDPDLWEKILLNLLSNALKFTFEGSISVRLTDSADGARLQIKDTGTGIPEKELARIFERFHRVEGAKSRSFEGSGIGLALVHELVKLHGGTVAVESLLDSGTTFTITIPYGEAHLDHEKVIADEAPPIQKTDLPKGFIEELARWGSSAVSRQTLGPDHQMTIVLADDNADMRNYIQELLLESGENWFVAVAANGHEALELARKHKPDLIITDVMMPELDGFGLLKAIRNDERLRTTPVIFLSARAGEDAKIEGITQGADDYLIKPFSAKELIARVCTQLELSAMRKAAAIQTEQVRSVEDQRKWLELLLDALPAGVVLLEPDKQTITFANRAAHRLAGGQFPIGETLERYKELFSPMDNTGRPLSAGETPAARALRGEKVSGAEIVWKAAKNLTNVMVDSEIIAAKFGHRKKVVLTLQDVTRLKSTEFELREAKNAAEAANRAKSQFLANMSHEIRTPLGVMIGFSELLLDPNMPKKEREDSLVTIIKNGKQLTNVINEILDLSKIEAERMTVEKIKFSVQEFLDEVSPMLVLQATESGVNFSVRLDETVPKEITTDPTRLKQIFINIVGNAIKFTRSPGEVAVRVSASARADLIEFTISDTGVGMTDEQQARLFQKFAQADDSMTRKFGGTGLGLYVSKKLAQLLGGDLRIEESQLGHGSTFVFSVKDSTKDEGHDGRIKVFEPVASSKAPPSIKDGKTILNDVRVLLVDDSSDNRVLVTRLLRSTGAQVTCAVDGNDAVQAALNSDFDVILMDIQMPVKDGFAATSDLRNLAYQKPIVALTAHAMKGDREKCLHNGFNDFLTKPVDKQQLIRVIEKVVGRE